MKCPVCDSEQVGEFFRDLMNCTRCTHIFKKEFKQFNNKTVFDLEHYGELKPRLQELKKYLAGEENYFEFIFPSVVFYGNELTPNIYKDDMNHYFTMNSIAKLTRELGFKIMKLDARWDGNLNETFLKVVLE